MSCVEVVTPQPFVFPACPTDQGTFQVSEDRSEASGQPGEQLGMVMTALAWNLKAWWALMLPERPGRWQQRHREEKQWVLGLEFKTFVNAFIHLPCQIIRTGRKLVYRLLSWNPYQRIFFRLITALRC